MRVCTDCVSSSKLGGGGSCSLPQNTRGYGDAAQCNNCIPDSTARAFCDYVSSSMVSLTLHSSLEGCANSFGGAIGQSFDQNDVCCSSIMCVSSPRSRLTGSNYCFAPKVQLLLCSA